MAEGGMKGSSEAVFHPSGAPDFLASVRADPELASLRADPRFKAFLKKMNLPE
jgi:hypothetical protein